MSKNYTEKDIEIEFDRQVQNLLQKGYPKKSKLSDEDFLKLTEPLKKLAVKLSATNPDLEKGYLPFVIVIKNDLIPSEIAMDLVERAGKKGVIKLFPQTAIDFDPIESVQIPNREVYLLVNIDRGRATINVRPADALKIIQGQNRSPLTIDEGIAIITQFPDFLMKNNCFSLLASRHTGDQKVPAIWINSEKRPNLGWCWDGNPHTWLGSASAGKRIEA